MQKIDFVKNINAIAEKLNSKEIVRNFNEGFSYPESIHDFSAIIPLLFLSKSNYDQIKTDEQYKIILAFLDAGSIYQETNLSILTKILKVSHPHELLTNKSAVALYTFHRTLVDMSFLAKNVLQSGIVTESLNNEIDNGVVIFQILIEGEGLETEQYIRIFTAINELVETISKVVGEDEQKSEIILLDSGSDTNVGVKSGVETAKSLFLIFKEVWDYITNFKFYKEKQKHEVLLESLSIRTIISEKVKAGIITQEEGLEYTHMIKTRTDNLIGMKVLPKQIVVDSNQIENRKLLADLEGTKLLSSGD